MAIDFFAPAIQAFKVYCHVGELHELEAPGELDVVLQNHRVEASSPFGRLQKEQIPVFHWPGVRQSELSEGLRDGVFPVEAKPKRRVEASLKHSWAR